MNDYNLEELLPIVSELSRQYTSNESTSISYDNAKKLMNAILYCIHEYLYQYNDMSHETNMIMQTDHPDAKEAYDTGYQLVIQKTMKAKDLYHDILNDFNSYGNQCYYDTIIQGLPQFFLYYDAKFNPQDHLLTLDYPTIVDVYDLCGVNAIYRYLQYIMLEQKFLKAFPEVEIIDMLIRYHENYEELLINICGIVLRYSLAFIMVGKTILYQNEFSNPSIDCKLQLDKEDYSKIRKFVLEHSRTELQNNIYQWIGELVQNHYHGDPILFQYLSFDAENFAVELQNAVKNDCLEVLLP